MSRDCDQQPHDNAENIELKEKKHKIKKKLKKENADDTLYKSTHSNPENGVASNPVPSNDSEFTKKKHKKKKKSKMNEESTGILDGKFQKDSDSETKPDKLKKCKDAVGKKRKAEATEEITTNNSVDETNSPTKKRKSKFSETVSEQTSSENSIPKHKKKKKAKGNDQEKCELENTSAAERKKRKKHEACESNTEAIEIIQSEALRINENGEKSSKKRKKHKKRMIEATEDSMSVAIPDICNSQAPVTVEDNETTVKKKKKRKKQKHESYDHSDIEEAPSAKSVKLYTSATKGSCSEKDQTHKKSKKHSKNKTSTEAIVNCAAEIATDDPSVGRIKYKKKKKSKKDDAQEEHDKKCLIPATSGKSADLPEDSGNSLQPKVTSPTDNSSTAAASQWGGNLFESTQRQDKFLRLLGANKNSDAKLGESKKLFSSTSSGPKKGLFGSLAPKASTGNAALSATAAADLNQRLEDEYNKAMNFKLTGKKGAGFGFAPDPAEGKKFHIDISKSKSVKFDD